MGRRTFFYALRMARELLDHYSTGTARRNARLTPNIFLNDVARAAPPGTTPLGLLRLLGEHAKGGPMDDDKLGEVADWLVEQRPRKSDTGRAVTARVFRDNAPVLWRVWGATFNRLVPLYECSLTPKLEMPCGYTVCKPPPNKYSSALLDADGLQHARYTMGRKVIWLRMFKPEEWVPTALYRHFDKRGRLLYVGISLSPLKRLDSHVKGSAWVADIATVTLEWLPSRALAERAEVAAIQNEDPLHNVRHKYNTMAEA